MRELPGDRDQDEPPSLGLDEERTRQRDDRLARDALGAPDGYRVSPRASRQDRAARERRGFETRERRAICSPGRLPAQVVGRWRRIGECEKEIAGRGWRRDRNNSTKEQAGGPLAGRLADSAGRRWSLEERRAQSARPEPLGMARPGRRRGDVQIG